MHPLRGDRHHNEMEKLEFVALCVQRWADGAVAGTEELVRGVRRLRIQAAGAFEYVLHPDRGTA
jgi:hypothetical protein